jgi:tetratricopeptide (TPR) repeat protein
MHPDTLTTRYNLALVPLERGVAAQKAGKPDEARGAFDTAFSKMAAVRDDAIRSLGRDDFVTVMIRSEAASLLNRLNRLPEAAAEYEPLLPDMRRALGVRHWRTLEATANYASSLRKEQKHREAATLYDEALLGYRETQGVTEEGTIIITNRLAQCYESLGELDHAAWLMERAYNDLAADPKLVEKAKQEAKLLADLYARRADGENAAKWRAK